MIDYDAFSSKTMDSLNAKEIMTVFALFDSSLTVFTVFFITAEKSVLLEWTKILSLNYYLTIK